MKTSPSPVIVGAAQFTQPRGTEKPLDPLGLMERACLDALGDAGAPGLRNLVDRLYVINLFQWPYRDAPGMLAERVGIRPEKSSYLPVGGNTPQLVVNRAARDLAAGRCSAVLMTGAEAIYSLRRAMKGAIVLDWPASEPPGRTDGENASGIDDLEAAYDLFLPSFVYPLFETSLRAASGMSPSEHRAFMGRAFERLSLVASRNPFAWSRRPLSAAEIATPGPDNRYIGFPYTKCMNANINVDQSAAIVLTTEEHARSLGIDAGQWVYPSGGADLNDIWNVTRRPCLHESPAIRHASRLALEQAGMGLEAIGAFDLYSCFPSAFEIARREVGIGADDPRTLSVTGGLPFFGGPGNNYSMHAIATVVDLIRQDRSLNAMVTANGWYLTKHSVGVYGGTPPARPWSDRDDSALQRSIDARALPAPMERAAGPLTVEAYVIRHDSGGAPVKGTVVGRLPDGRRALADIDAGPEELLSMEEAELVGMTGEARYDGEIGKNLVRFDSLG